MNDLLVAIKADRQFLALLQKMHSKEAHVGATVRGVQARLEDNLSKLAEIETRSALPASQ